MYRISLTSSILVLLACLPIELSAHSQTEAAKSSTVSGRVISNGMPFRNATVVLQPEPPPNPQDKNAIFRTRTDQNGNFKITGISAGRYRIFASAARFVMPVDKSFGESGMVISIGEAENILRPGALPQPPLPASLSNLETD